ncbi:DUF5808 domain-containing protein [Virgibacillus sp. C22-A2]|uniref:DUF5808 domain-containing protein n=1 Tax=Virgibacillus tibetensis TaxID=3042313 RepID=A0ABU6KG69_9BACI|nr:DUF5808 domain-containing protein [Virgibacillus sp. C22-A2]
MNSIIVILIVVILIPAFISLMFIPYWTRKTESFGVTIPEEIYNTPRLTDMRKRYTLITGILSVSVIALFIALSAFTGDNDTGFSLILGSTVIIYMISSFLVYLKFHREMKILKKKENWMAERSQQVFINTRFRDQKLSYSNAWFILSFAIAFATIALTFRLYNQIPDQIPMQYNFTGYITNWVDKSYRTVLVMPIQQLYLTLLFLFINSTITKAKQQINARNPEESLRKNVIFRRRWSAFIIISGTALVIMFAIIQLSFIFPINHQLLIVIPLVLSIGITISAVVLSFTTGQGGSRVNSDSGETGDIMDYDDDKFWKLGQFYFNKNDPALFLEKRFGVGWTINLARPLAWIIFLAIILIAVGIPVLLGA